MATRRLRHLREAPCLFLVPVLLWQMLPIITLREVLTEATDSGRGLKEVRWPGWPCWHGFSEVTAHCLFANMDTSDTIWCIIMNEQTFVFNLQMGILVNNIVDIFTAPSLSVWDIRKRANIGNCPGLLFSGLFYYLTSEVNVTVYHLVCARIQNF